MLDLNKLSIAAFILFLVSACNQNAIETGHEHQLVESKYGHLNTLNKNYLKNTFLIHHDPKESYDICLSTKTARNFPGIEQELVASINIWGHYIGRNIQVNFVHRDLPLPDTNWTGPDKHNRFKEICPKGVELIVAEDREKSGSIAYTHQQANPKWNGHEWIADKFSRVLMIRTVKASGERNNKFFSLQELTGEHHSADQILKILKQRNTKIFSPHYKRIPLITTLMHEVGHIWGLCDMYHVTSGSNCDPDHSSHRGAPGVHIEKESIMYSASNISPFFLRDDDLNGIKTLDDRFDSDPKIKYENAEVPSEIPAEKNAYTSELVKINSFNKTDTHLVLNLNLETNGGKVLAIQYKTGKGDSWFTASKFQLWDESKFSNYPFKFRDSGRIRGAYAYRILLIAMSSDDEESTTKLIYFDSENGLTQFSNDTEKFFTSSALKELNKPVKKPEIKTDEEDNPDSESESESEKDSDVKPPVKIDEEDKPEVETDEEDSPSNEEGNSSEKKSEKSESKKESKIEITIIDDKKEKKVTIDDLFDNEPSKTSPKKDDDDKAQENEREKAKSESDDKKITVDDLFRDIPKKKDEEDTGKGDEIEPYIRPKSPEKDDEIEPYIRPKTETEKEDKVTPASKDENEKDDDSKDKKEEPAKEKGAQKNGIDLMKFLKSMQN